ASLEGQVIIVILLRLGVTQQRQSSLLSQDVFCIDLYTLKPWGGAINPIMQPPKIFNLFTTKVFQPVVEAETKFHADLHPVSVQLCLLSFVQPRKQVIKHSPAKCIANVVISESRLVIEVFNDRQPLSTESQELLRTRHIIL